MKKNISVIMILVVFMLAGKVLNAQTIDVKKIVGFWTSESTSTCLVFFKDIKDSYQLVEWSSKGGEQMLITEIKVEGNTIKTTELFQSTNYTTTNTYYLTDENTLKNTIGGDTNSVIYYKRQK
jgi:hypothetical protein